MRVCVWASTQLLEASFKLYANLNSINNTSTTTNLEEHSGQNDFEQNNKEKQQHMTAADRGFCCGNTTRSRSHNHYDAMSD